MSGKRDIDELSGVHTTGHEWDGIKELNHPLPRWWLWTLYATIVWAIGYVIVYPAIPGVSSATRGLWEWSSRADVRAEQAAVAQGRDAVTAKLASMDINAILADPELRSFAVAAGASHFKVYCVQCHGSGAQGARGFPNLNDDSWLWGGQPDQVVKTIAHGIRDVSNSDTRDSMMPAFGKDGVLDGPQMANVTAYVRKLGNLEHDATAASAGEAVYTENCVSCHGEKGEGNQEFGAPQLNDAIWLISDDAETIAAQIREPRHGMMPGWQKRLGEGAVKQLAAYVLSLGGGQ